MKTKNLFGIVLGVLPVMMSCSHGDVEWSYHTYSHKVRVGYEVLSEGDEDMSNVPWETYEDQCLNDMPTSNDKDTTDSVARVSPITAMDLIRELADGVIGEKVHQVAVTYKSVDVNGDSIDVSGKIFYPKDGKIRNVILASHYTIGADREAPSQTYSFEGIYAAYGYCVVAADYIGFGVSKEKVHPYLQAATCGRNVIDIARVAMTLIEDRKLLLQSDEIILFGYSQGGACTMHVMRMLETYPEYANEFKIKQVYAGAGPYDVARTYDFCVEQDETGIPCAVPMIIQGMSLGMSPKLDMEYFFKEPLLSNYEDWLNSKKYTTNEINQKIGSNYLHDILTENAMNREKEETARFYYELMENNVPSNFVPKAPLHMFHSLDDQTVPYINSDILRNQFRTAYPTDGEAGQKTDPVNVSYDFGHYGTHMRGAVVFIYKTAQKLK